MNITKIQEKIEKIFEKNKIVWGLSKCTIHFGSRFSFDVGYSAVYHSSSPTKFLRMLKSYGEKELKRSITSEMYRECLKQKTKHEYQISTKHIIIDCACPKDKIFIICNPNDFVNLNKIKKVG